jgi:hypothetical protein
MKDNWYIISGFPLLILTCPFGCYSSKLRQVVRYRCIPGVFFSSFDRLYVSAFIIFILGVSKQRREAEMLHIYMYIRNLFPLFLDTFFSRNRNNSNQCKFFG